MNKIEKIANKAIRLIFKEYDRCPDQMKCRTIEDVLSGLYSKYGNEEVFSSLRLLSERKLLNVLNRPDGQAIQPNEYALSTRTELEEKNKSRIIKLCAWGVGILIAGFGVFSEYF